MMPKTTFYPSPRPYSPCPIRLKRAGSKPFSDGAPARLRGVDQLVVDRTDAADRDDGGFAVAAYHAVVMRRSGDAVDVAAGRGGHAGRRVEIGAAVAPPGARDDHAEPVGRVGVRRAH